MVPPSRETEVVDIPGRTGTGLNLSRSDKVSSGHTLPMEGTDASDLVLHGSMFIDTFQSLESFVTLVH